MIDRDQEIGTRVVFIGPLYNDLSIKVGDVGIIAYVDHEDANMTYKVKFPSESYSMWVGNDRVALHQDLLVDTEHCGWRERALTAEAALKDLQKALKTLSEG